jgi:hypothetical protein
MSKLAKGPFELQWNNGVLAGIETVAVTYTVKEDDLESVQGNTYTVFGAHKAGVEITLLETDVPSLAIVLSQYYVPMGGVLSTGETVTDVDGAIDIVPGQESDPHSLIITSAGNPGQVVRLLEATTEISGMDITGTLRTLKVKFTGTPDQGKATMQFFKEGAIAVVS